MWNYRGVLIRVQRSKLYLGSVGPGYACNSKFPLEI